MKKIYLLFLLVLLPLVASAYDAKIDGIYYNLYSSGETKTAEVTYKSTNYSNYTAISDYSGDVVIPESVTYGNDKYRVTSIGNDAFYKCSGLTSITIPNSVTSIGNYAFSGCSGLTSITIPNSVTSIGYSAFYGCSGLTSITIPNSVTSIDSSVFSGCSGLTSMEVPGANTKYDSRGNCNAIIETATNTLIAGCKNTEIPTDVTSIGTHAFSGCSGLTSVTIPNSVITIGFGAFYNCSGLTSVTIPNSVTTIDKYAFTGCVNMVSAVIGSGVTSIGAYAFSVSGDHFSSFLKKTIWLTNTSPMGASYAEGTINYVSNDQYDISNKVVYPFLSSCFDVDGIRYVPVSLSEKTCDAIDCVYNESVKDIVISSTVTYEGTTMTVKNVQQYLGYNNKYIESLTIDNNGELGAYSFYGCSNLKSVKLGDKITMIGDKTFQFCSGLTSTSVTIGNSVTSIGREAFCDFSGLTSLVIGSGVTSIGYQAFNSTNLKKTIWLTNTPPTGASNAKGEINYVSNEQFDIGNKVVYPLLSSYFDVDGIRYIPVSLSERTCDAIDCVHGEIAENVKIGPTVEYKGIILTVKNVQAYIGYGNSFIKTVSIDGDGELGNYAFTNCSNINSIIFGTNMTSIGSDAFNGCSSFEKIKIKPLTTDIKRNAFSNCSSLKEVIIEDGETELNLGAKLFGTCPLDSVYIGRNINYSTNSGDGYSPFYNNKTLRAVKITDKETEISDNEFYGCTNLQRVIIGDGVTSIGNWAFSGCQSLKFFTFGSEVKTIGQEAFSDCTAITEITSRAINPPTCGSQALDDINKWDCNLYVPKGCLAAYQAADQWKEFLFAQEGDYTIAAKYTLTYMVDGETYKSYQVAEGSTITPEPAPTKEGYTFSGWSTIPATMPAEDVTITGTFTKNVIPSNVEPITVGKSGKASYCSSKSLDFSFSDEIKAYIATGFDETEGTIWLTRVKDVPAGTPILIKGEANKTYDVPVTDTKNSYYENLFKGNTSGATVQVNETDGNMVNYYLSGDGTFKSVKGYVNIGNNKSYLQLPGTFAPAEAGTTQTVKVGSSGKASYAAPVDLDFTNVDGLKAFTATGYDKSSKTIWLTRVMKVQKGEGVLLKGDAKDYEIPSVAVQSSYMNMFKGNTSGASVQVQETSADGSKTNFYLKGDGTFVSVNGYVNIGNNKCYLELPTDMVAGAASTRGAEANYLLEEPEVFKLPISFRSIDNDGNGTTAIRETKQSREDGAYYTLQGQRVVNPGKGLYIHNGKKVVIK